MASGKAILTIFHFSIFKDIDRQYRELKDKLEERNARQDETNSTENENNKTDQNNANITEDENKEGDNNNAQETRGCAVDEGQNNDIPIVEKTPDSAAKTEKLF